MLCYVDIMYNLINSYMSNSISLAFATKNVIWATRRIFVRSPDSLQAIRPVTATEVAWAPEH